MHFIIFQEFGFENIQQFAEKFGKIAQKVYNSITKAVRSFENLLKAGRGLNIGEIFDNFQSIIKDLPKKVFNFPKITKRILQTIEEAPIGLPPSVEKLKHLSHRIQTLFKDIREDVMTVHDVSIILE